MKNKDKLAYHRNYYRKNRERLLAQARAYLKDPAKRERRRLQCARYYRNNKAKIRAKFVIKYEKNKPVFLARSYRNHLRVSYGLTPEAWDEIKKKQGYLCAICFERKKLSVDHCHRTGHVRGGLCFACNISLGHMGDNVSKLQAMIKYLSAA